MKATEEKLKVATFCSGIGAFEEAIKELGIPHEVIFYSEIDKYARKTYEANHDFGFLIPDMTKCDYVGSQYYADLVVAGLPCQAFSLAGKRLGELDPRGLLFYDFYKYVKNQQPKFFIIENVKGLLSDNNGETFRNWINLLGQSENSVPFFFPHEDSLMYNLHWEVLNTKDYELPQNRERVFIVGIRNDLPGEYNFPAKKPLKLRLKDILETHVDEKYYLSDKMIEGFISHAERHQEKGNGFKFEPKELDSIANTITTTEGSRGYNNFIEDKNEIANCITARCFKMGIDDNYIKEDVVIGAMRGRNPQNPKSRESGLETEQMFEINQNGTSNCLTSVQKDNLVLEIKSATKSGFETAEIGDSINIEHPNSSTPSGRVGKGVAQTLTTSCNQAVIEPKNEIIQLNNPKHSNYRIDSVVGISPTLNTMQGGNRQPFIAEEFSGVAVHPFSKKLEFNGFKDTECPTLLATDYKAPKCVQFTNYRIRRLTPRECFRLQGFSDEFFDKSQKVNSDTQLYKQAGNSISTTVIKSILKNLIK